MKNLAPNLYAGAEYQLAAPPENADSAVQFSEEQLIGWNLERFFDFYQTSGHYQVSRDGSTLTIKSGQDSYTFTFVEHAGQAFFTLQVSRNN